MLELAGTERGLVLVVGGHSWAREIAAALQRAGVAVRVWVGSAADREAARAAGIEADRGRMMLDAVNREAELEEVADVLLLTRSDDFNAVAAGQLRSELGHGHVFRLAPDPEEPDLLPPSLESGILGDSALTYPELERLFAEGARLVERRAADSGGGDSSGELPLFAVANGSARVATAERGLDVRPGDSLVVLERAGSAHAAPRRSEDGDRVEWRAGAAGDPEG